MLDYDDKFYPNLIVKDAEGFKKLERIDQFKEGNTCPKIRWGSEYNKQSLRWRMKYAEGVASAMNHAADLLQKERNELLRTCRDQNTALEALTRQLAEHTVQSTGLQTRANTKLQDANETIVEKQGEIRKLREAFQRLRGLFIKYVGFSSVHVSEHSGFTESELKSIRRLEELAKEQKG